MAHDGNSLRVDFFQRNEVIDRPLNSPGPCRDGRRLGAFFSQVWPYAFTLVGLVGINVTIVKRGYRVTTIDRLVDGPNIHALAAAGLGSAIVFHAGLIGIHPRIG